MKRIDPIILQKILTQQLDLLRLEAGVRARVERILRDLLRELSGLIANEDLTAFGKARMNALIREAAAAIDNYYLRAQGELDLTMLGVAKVQTVHTAAILNTHFSAQLAVGLPTEKFIEKLVSNVLIQGAPSAEWWSRQSQDTAFKFANAVRQGAIQGETNTQIVKRVRDVMDVSASNARSLVHSSIQTVANEARRETFKKNDDVVVGVEQVSTLDGHTTEICIAYDGAQWDLDGNPIGGNDLPYNGGAPRHWGCRSVEVPITKTFRELGIDVAEPLAGLRASAEGPTSMTMKQFLDSRTKDQLDDQLGVGRAELFRSGVITRSQLLDLRCNPLSLSQLQSKYL